MSNKIEVVTELNGWTAGGKILPAVDQIGERNLARYWSKVEKGATEADCWQWKCTKEEYGYGQFRIGKIRVAAHRLAFALSVGRWPKSSNVVLHHCDNPSCVNPDHLSEGSLSDNLTEAWRRGRRSGTVFWKDRSLPAIRRGRSRLSEWDVLEIRRLRAGGKTVEALALEFDVRPPTIRDVCNGRTFQWVVGGNI